MRNVNTMGQFEYVWENVYWSFLVFLLYRNFLFLPLFTFDYRQSSLLLVSSIIFGLSVGILLTHKHRRNHVSLVSNVILAYGIYYTLSLWFIDRSLLGNLITIAAVLAACYASLVFSTYIIERARNNVDVSIWRCLSSVLLNCRTLAAFVLAFSIMFSISMPLLGFPFSEIQEDTVILDTAGSQPEGETISKNMEAVLLLQEDSWAKLDATERLNVMKVIADIEANYLGIPKVSICTEVLDEHTFGHYNNSTRTITLNLSYLTTASARTMLTTVCHESYHAYQYRLVELYEGLKAEDKDLLLFNEAAQYRDEFANYVDGSDNYYTYSRQWCEADSEEYAEDAVIDYYYRIEQHINEHRSGEENVQ